MNFHNHFLRKKNPPLYKGRFGWDLLRVERKEEKKIRGKRKKSKTKLNYHSAAPAAFNKSNQQHNLLLINHSTQELEIRKKEVWKIRIEGCKKCRGTDRKLSLVVDKDRTNKAGLEV